MVHSAMNDAITLSLKQLEGISGVGAETARFARSPILQGAIDVLGQSSVQDAITSGRSALQQAISDYANAAMGSSRSPLSVDKSIQPTRNSASDDVISGMTVSGHTLDQMQNRGITISPAQQALEKGLIIPPIGSGYIEQRYDPINNIRTIVNNATDTVITIMRSRPDVRNR